MSTGASLPVTAKVSEADLDALDRLKSRTGRSISSLIREAIRSMLEAQHDDEEEDADEFV